MPVNLPLRIPEGPALLDRPIRDLLLSDGHWHMELRQDFPAGGAALLGPFRLAGGAAVSVHITRTAVPPVGAFVGDPGERSAAYVSLLVEAHGVTGLEAEHATPAGRAAGTASGEIRWAQHLPVTQERTVRQALATLFGRLKNPFDPADAAQLEAGEVLEVRRDTAAQAALSVTWDAVVLRELVPLGRVRVSLGEPLQVHSGAAAAVTVTMRAAGRLTVTVERGDRGPDWVRVRVRHHHEDVAGSSLRLTASLLPQGLDRVARAVLGQALGSGGDPVPAEHLGALSSNLVQRVADRIREGAMAAIGAALNRTRGREALADIQFRLPGRTSEYGAAVSHGDLAPAQQAAAGGREAGIALGACLLQQHLRRHRTVTVSLRLLGYSLDREAGRLASLRVTTGADGALWVAGSAAATLSRRTRRQLEDMAILFDLHAAAGQSGADIDLTASLQRTAVVSRGRRAATAAARRHLSAAVGLGRLDLVAAEKLAEELDGQPLPYVFRLTAEFTPRAARRLFALDDPGLGPTLYRARLWAVYSTAVRTLGLTVPAADPRRPCPLWRLVTEERIAAIRRQPFLALEPRRLPPLTLEGFRLDLAAARGFWLHLAHAHAFIEAVAATRRLLQRADPAADLGRTISSLATLAGRLRDHAGWLGGEAAEDRHLMLPLLVGADECDLRLSLARGGLDVTV